MNSCELRIDEFPLYWTGKPSRKDRISVGLIDVHFEIGYDTDASDWWIVSIMIDADRGGKEHSVILSREDHPDLWMRIYLNLEDLYEDKVSDAIAIDCDDRKSTYDELEADYRREMRAAS